MENLASPFFQLLSFLKDPESHIYTRTGPKRFQPICSIAFPELNLEDIVYLPTERLHNGVMVHGFRQEAIEIMESTMFRNGRLKGNQKTGDLEIKHIEEFVLPMGAVIHITKDYLAHSWPEMLLHTFDGTISLYNELQTAWHNLIVAFDKVAKITLDNRLTHPVKLVGINAKKRAEIEAKMKKLVDEENWDKAKWDEIDRILKKSPAGIRGDLFVIRAKSLQKAHQKDLMNLQKQGFDTISYIIRIFLSNATKFSDYLIARHVFNFVNERRDSTLKGLYLPEIETDALKKEVKKQRSLAWLSIPK